MSRRFPPPRVLVALGAVALPAAPLATGCGDSAARAQGGAITVYAREYAQLPRRLDAAPGRLELVLRNTGVLDHDLVVRRGDETLARLAPVAPGGTGRLAVRLAAGTYELACREWRHDQLGEHATLRVR